MRISDWSSDVCSSDLQIEAILDSLQILALDVPADTEYAGIRAELEAAGKPIGPNDWFIAAHAYALEAVLVTANITDFSRIRALTVENWKSEERRVGKEWVSKFRSRWSPYH